MFDGQRLRAKRESRRISQTTLAEKLGVSQGLISQWENNLKSPGKKRLSGIASFLEIPESNLMEESKKIQRDKKIDQNLLRAMHDAKNILEQVVTLLDERLQ